MDLTLIPIQALPDQVFYIDLAGQECEIHVFLRGYYMYMDLKVDDVDIFKGQICLNNVDMVQYRNMNFVGNLRFLDTQGSEDPYYSGFGERWVLVYVQ